MMTSTILMMMKMMTARTIKVKLSLLMVLIKTVSRGKHGDSFNNSPEGI